MVPYYQGIGNGVDDGSFAGGGFGGGDIMVKCYNGSSWSMIKAFHKMCIAVTHNQLHLMVLE